MSYGEITFTFQYVSINTTFAACAFVTGKSLHSNMFLLIQYVTSALNACTSSFTFQYVSINTGQPLIAKLGCMILYIPICFY